MLFTIGDRDIPLEKEKPFVRDSTLSILPIKKAYQLLFEINIALAKLRQPHTAASRTTNLKPRAYPAEDYIPLQILPQSRSCCSSPTEK